MNEALFLPTHMLECVIGRSETLLSLCHIGDVILDHEARDYIYIHALHVIKFLEECERANQITNAPRHKRNMCDSVHAQCAQVIIVR